MGQKVVVGLGFQAEITRVVEAWGGECRGKQTSETGLAEDPGAPHLWLIAVTIERVFFGKQHIPDSGTSQQGFQIAQRSCQP